MKYYSLKTVSAALMSAIIATTVSAEVPGIMSYQGHVQVNGTNFTGTGQFKFALVDGGSNTVRQATATAIVSGGFLVDYTVTDGGSGYVTPPAVTITDSTGSGATATAQISGGVVTNIQANTAGSGYSASPSVTIDPPPVDLVFVTYWSNDGTSVEGSEPAAAVSVPVQDGLFTVLLGDSNLVNMTEVPASVFENSDVHLRLWFDDGANGFARLAPDQRLAAAGYAFKSAQADSAATADVATTASTATSASSASSVPWTGITGIPGGFADGIDANTTYSAGTGLNLVGTTFSIANSGVGTAQLANSSVTSSKLGDGSVGSDQLANDADSLGKMTGNTIRKVSSNLGVNTATPTARLDVAGTARFRGSSSAVGLKVESNGDVSIGATNNKARLHVADNPSGFEPVAYRTAIIENSGGVSLALRSTSTSTFETHSIYFERPVGELGALLHLDADDLFMIGRHIFTSLNSANSVYYLRLDLNNGNLGIQRTPTANDLEVAGNASKATAGSWLANSDRRIKTDIRDIPDARVTLMKLHPVRFRYTDEWRRRNPSIEDHDYYNFIAQEYREVFPHAVKGSGEYLDGNQEEILQLHTHDAQIVAIKAVQELIHENQSLRAEMDELKNLVAELAAKLNGGVQ